MKCSLGISNFLKETSSLSHSIVFLYFCTDHWGRLSYLSLLFFGTLHSNGYCLPFSPLLFASLFTAICKASSDSHFSFLHFSWLKNKKTKIMASSPITSWQIDGETVQTVSDFILGGSKITADYDCSHEIKRCLLLGRKVMTNLYSILKSRDITLPTNVHLIKAMVFPVDMYGCESWTIKKVERWRMDAFELWCWRRLLRVP